MCNIDVNKIEKMKQLIINNLHWKCKIEFAGLTSLKHLRFKTMCPFDGKREVIVSSEYDQYIGVYNGINVKKKFVITL